MTNSDASPEKPQIIVDEDWKSKVQREKEGQDQVPAQDAPVASSETKPVAGREAQQIPAPDFLTLVAMFSTQSLVALGMIPDPVKQEPEANLPLARHFIDLLALLETKTKGNLTPEEAKTLEANLHYLRMAYLELSSGTKA